MKSECFGTFCEDLLIREQSRFLIVLYHSARNKGAVAKLLKFGSRGGGINRQRNYGTSNVIVRNVKTITGWVTLGAPVASITTSFWGRGESKKK